MGHGRKSLRGKSPSSGTSQGRMGKLIWVAQAITVAGFFVASDKLVNWEVIRMNSYQQHGQEMMGCLMIFIIGVLPFLLALGASIFIPWMIPLGILAIYYWILYRGRKKIGKKAHK